MRIHKLRINEIRGIRHLELDIGGRSAVVVGANGTGKSGIVDAIDFLLTGSITRLTGVGTGSVTIQRHGAHIISNASEAWIEAEVEFPTIEGRFTLRRNLSSPNDLICDAVVRELVSAVEVVARNGQHALTRRDILQFIASRPQDRATQIQRLLKLQGIESIRGVLRSAVTKARDEARLALAGVQQAEMATLASANLTTFRPELLLTRINELRAVLDAAPIHEPTQRNMLEGVHAFNNPSDGVATAGVAERDLQALIEYLSEQASALVEADQRLRIAASLISGDDTLRLGIHRRALYERGLEALTTDGTCPLCETAFEPGILHEHFNRKLANATEAEAAFGRLTAAQEVCLRLTTRVIASIQQALSSSQLASLPVPDQLVEWEQLLQTYQQECQETLQDYSLPGLIPDLDQPLFASPDIQDVLKSLHQEAHSHSLSVDPKQTSHELLTRIDENLGQLETAKLKAANAVHLRDFAEELQTKFINARNNILNSLYDDISDRFAQFYKILHPHEAAFSAQLLPTTAGVNLEVQFLDYGMHSPIALHSEGHQDSMGFCLFLALSEKVSASTLQSIVLDDVVMSVDREHRRDICRLLHQEFSDRQFIITTHDVTWSRQLRREQVVNGHNVIEFSNWSVEDGPSVGQFITMWQSIEAHLEMNRIPAAASELRRGMEEFFEQVCANLRGKVIYKSDGRWELGDYLPAAIEAYKSLLARAIRSADAWNNRDESSRLRDLERLRSTVVGRSKAEEWMINPEVHYSRWADFTANEFREVVDAFRDLQDMFTCSVCGSFLEAIGIDHRPSNVECPCGGSRWNLQMPAT